MGKVLNNLKKFKNWLIRLIGGNEWSEEEIKKINEINELKSELLKSGHSETSIKQVTFGGELLEEDDLDTLGKLSTSGKKRKIIYTNVDIDFYYAENQNKREMDDIIENVIYYNLDFKKFNYLRSLKKGDVWEFGNNIYVFSVSDILVCNNSSKFVISVCVFKQKKNFLRVNDDSISYQKQIKYLFENVLKFQTLENDDNKRWLIDKNKELFNEFSTSFKKRDKILLRLKDRLVKIIIALIPTSIALYKLPQYSSAIVVILIFIMGLIFRDKITTNKSV